MSKENIKPDSFATDGESADNESGTVLLPCPWCGGKAHISEICSLGKVRGYTVACNDDECFGFHSFSFYDTEAEAIAAWNIRAERTYAPKPKRHKIEAPWDNGKIDVDTWYCECGKELFTRGKDSDWEPEFPNYCDVCGVKLVGDEE